jgi:hypothetical protein
MNITDHLRQATDAPAGSLDLEHVARVARAQGMRARRRRRGVAVLGSAVLVGAVVVGSVGLLGQDPDRSGLPVVGSGGPTPSTSSTIAPAPSLDPSDTGRLTGRGVTAGLRHAVREVAQGRAGAFAGQGGAIPDDDAYGQLDWTDVDGLGVSVVGINVQPGMDYVSSCGSTQRRCTRTRSADGRILTTYEEHTPVAGGVGIRRVADLLRPDGVRVLASATNGYELPANRWNVTRPRPPLSYAQLTEIVQQPWWGAQLPTYLLDQGERLAPYDDLDQSIAVATPSKAPAS